jgi:hypothetical protein
MRRRLQLHAEAPAARAIESSSARIAIAPRMRRRLQLPALQLQLQAAPRPLRQYLHFCTSEASKLSTSSALAEGGVRRNDLIPLQKRARFVCLRKKKKCTALVQEALEAVFRWRQCLGSEVR